MGISGLQMSPDVLVAGESIPLDVADHLDFVFNVVQGVRFFSHYDGDFASGFAPQGDHRRHGHAFRFSQWPGLGREVTLRIPDGDPNVGGAKVESNYLHQVTSSLLVTLALSRTRPAPASFLVITPGANNLTIVPVEIASAE